MIALSPVPGMRVAVIGACGGIGLAVVDELRKRGAVPLSLDLEASIREANLPDAIPIDVQDRDSVVAAFCTVKAAGELHGMVNLAGFAAAKQPVASVDPATWDEVIAVNLGGAFNVAQAALPLLRDAARPDAPCAIVNVASGLAARLMPGYGPYGASKAGLIALTKSLAVENAPLVRANAVAPGAIQTAFLTGGTGRSAGTGPSLDVDAYLRSVPMGRIGRPADVAGPILFLLSPAAGYMTGQVLWVNGGALTP